MSDHALGLIGVAFALISIVAPFRWPKMHRALTDFGLIAGSVLIGVAVAPLVGTRAFPTAVPWSQSAPIKIPPHPVIQKAAHPADQKMIDDLRTQLAATKNELSSTQAELGKAKDLLALSDLVVGWGVDPPNVLWMSVDTSRMYDKYNRALKLMFIAHAVYSDVDGMTDPHIVKSGTYCLTSGKIKLAKADLAGLHILADKQSLVEFDLIGLPMTADPEKIATLADVEKINGRILSGKTMYITGMSRP